jgi:hypothetical protein
LIEWLKNSLTVYLAGSREVWLFRMVAAALFQAGIAQGAGAPIAAAPARAGR